MGKEAMKLRKPRGYWKDEGNVERELRQLIDALGRFPSIGDVRDSGSPGLNNAMTMHGGITHWRERVGFVAAHRPSGYWNDPVNVERALSSWIAEHGRFPTFAELADAGQGGLVEAIIRHGGFAVWRDRFGETAATRPRGFWLDAANVERALASWIGEHGSFPTHKELKESGNTALGAAISRHGGIPVWREKFTAALLRNPMGFWDDPQNVERELRTWTAEHGRFPSHVDLRGSGHGGLADAVARHGGIDHWRQRFGLESRRNPPGYWDDPAHVESGLKDWIAQNGGFPSQRELAQSGRLDLRVAIAKHGGLTAWRAKLGYGPITPESLREHADVLARVVMALNVADTAAFWAALQARWTMHQLTEAIREFTEEGRVERFRALLTAAG